MSNVLSPNAKKQLDRRARWRALLVLGCAGTLAAFIAILSLVPTFISIASARASLDAPSVEELGTAREFQAQARRTQALVDALEPLVMASSTPSEMLADALALMPDGVSVTIITYHGAQNQLILDGEAPQRASVNAFRDALQKSERFKKVEVPVGALAGTQEGRFTVTLTAL